VGRVCREMPEVRNRDRSRVRADGMARPEHRSSRNNGARGAAPESAARRSPGRSALLQNILRRVEGGASGGRWSEWVDGGLLAGDRAAGHAERPAPRRVSREAAQTRSVAKIASSVHYPGSTPEGVVYFPAAPSNPPGRLALQPALLRLLKRRPPSNPSRPGPSSGSCGWRPSGAPRAGCSSRPDQGTASP
jgi:hypothetical protein